MTVRLSREHRFIGRATISGGWCYALILLQADTGLHIFLPGLYRSDKELPASIEGRIRDWHFSVTDDAISVSCNPSGFDSLNRKMKLEAEEKKFFPSDCNSRAIWTEITFMGETCTFTKLGLAGDVPDEWGITFYPEKNNSILFHFFSDDRNPYLLRPKIFSIPDRSMYLSNNERWNLEAIRERLKLLTSCLSFFTGSPVSYELLVGKYKKEILVIQFKNESNPNDYICPSPYNACIELKGKALSSFPSVFVMKVEEISGNNSERQKILILLSYFEMLYMACHDEAKIAFSFQLMEALAKYKKIGVKSAQFNQYIKKALDALKTKDAFEVKPTLVKEIARKYRNEVFHGNFFDEITEINTMIGKLPIGYQRDLPLVFQSIAAMIGVNFILGIDFKEMIALKRLTYQ